jgi:hypothetical protein
MGSRTFEVDLVLPADFVGVDLLFLDVMLNLNRR